MGAIKSKLRRCGVKNCLFVFCAPAQILFGKMRGPPTAVRAHFIRRDALQIRFHRLRICACVNATQSHATPFHDPRNRRQAGFAGRILFKSQSPLAGKLLPRADTADRPGCRRGLRSSSETGCSMNRTPSRFFRSIGRRPIRWSFIRTARCGFRSRRSSRPLAFQGRLHSPIGRIRRM